MRSRSLKGNMKRIKPEEGIGTLDHLRRKGRDQSATRKRKAL